MGSLLSTPSLLSRVTEFQGQDTEILSIKDRVRSRTGDEGWAMHIDGSLRYRGLVVIPMLGDLREYILKDFHCSHFIVHLGGKKMYHNLRR